MVERWAGGGGNNKNFSKCLVILELSFCCGSGRRSVEMIAIGLRDTFLRFVFSSSFRIDCNKRY